MSGVVGIGQTHEIEGFALAGVRVISASTDAEITAAWAGLGRDVGLVILSPSAAKTLHDRLESTLKQALRFAITEKEIDEATEVDAKANLLLAFVVGRWHQFAKSGFNRDPMQHWTVQSRELI